ncbi:lipoyl synthase [Candidatus Woesearchaeota archaeon]|nr:lipoyl synthase [Candidatus Woesearchaeota archaeon]
MLHQHNIQQQDTVTTLARLFPEQQRKPSWFKIQPPRRDGFENIRHVLRSRNLHTVCEEAHCPNMAECWAGCGIRDGIRVGTATFMVLGDTCTRACKFCAVKTGNPRKQVDSTEPENLASAIAEMKLGYAVITSVDRDDLPDEGASHIAACIKSVREKHPATRVEVLIPDFKGRDELIQLVINAKPDVIAHNIETVKRLQRKIRDPRAGYEQSIHVLNVVKHQDPAIITKSSIMLGLGEAREEVIEAMKDLRSIGVSILTLGQYLRPSQKHTPVIEYVNPMVFEEYKKRGEELGFAFVAAGPLVRSSYRAGELFVEHILERRQKGNN